jgi:hypothetical protein
LPNETVQDFRLRPVALSGERLAGGNLHDWSAVPVDSRDPVAVFAGRFSLKSWWVKAFDGLIHCGGDDDKFFSGDIPQTDFNFGDAAAGDVEVVPLQFGGQIFLRPFQLVAESPDLGSNMFVNWGHGRWRLATAISALSRILAPLTEHDVTDR